MEFSRTSLGTKQNISAMLQCFKEVSELKPSQEREGIQGMGGTSNNQRELWEERCWKKEKWIRYVTSKSTSTFTFKIAVKAVLL